MFTDPYFSFSVMSAIAGPLLGLSSAASNFAYFLPALVAAIAYFQYEMLDPESRPIDVSSEELLERYDFIVVGAGSAGKLTMQRILFEYNYPTYSIHRGCCGKPSQRDRRLESSSPRSRRR